MIQPMTSRTFLFVVGSMRRQGVVGNTELLAREAAAALPAGVAQRWVHLNALTLPPFDDIRHHGGAYPMPGGDLRLLLDATLEASDLVLVSPVYWYSVPAALKLYIDHWSAWLRVPGVEFKARMAGKRLWVVSTSGGRESAQPMFDSYALCARFLGMQWMGPLWGKGGPPDAVLSDADARAAASGYFSTSDRSG
jgi:multimeric flavodoxin WrbA